MYNTMTPNDIQPMDGMITGKWLNKLTGKVINVVNTVIDGDNMIIISDIGQIDMDDFSRNYIQASDEIYNEAGKVIGREEFEFTPIEQPLYNNQYNNQQPKTSKSDTQNKPKEKEEIKIIKKVFSKIFSTPSISIDVQWDDFPKDQLNTLINFLDIDINEIATYITQTYMDTSSISLLVKKFLEEKLK